MVVATANPDSNCANGNPVVAHHVWAESPRWLIGKGKDEQALKILAKYHGGGDPNHPLVIYEYEEMRKAIAEEHDNKVGWTHLFDARDEEAIIYDDGLGGEPPTWSGNAMISYYLNQVSFQITRQATSAGSLY